MKPGVWPLMLILLFSACKEPFMPEIPDTQTNVLVVEGYINVGQNAVTTISLSRTTSVSESAGADVEAGAQVSIESEFGNEFLLAELKSGQYVSDPLDLPLNRRYRIVIKTSNGHTYTSAYSTPIVTPPIDSVTWQWSPDGVGIHVTTHDVAQGTTYYQWDYEETWSVPSPYQSFYIYQDGTLKNRTVDERIAMRQCWKYHRLSDLITASTAAMNTDVIEKKLLKWIPIHAEQLNEKYSILVKQHALSKEAFEYLEVMKKNTNNVGSFTDPQPSQLFGNIQASNNQLVVGLIEAYTTEEYRLFISVEELTYWNFSMFCEDLLIANDKALQDFYFATELWLVTKASADPLAVWGAPAPCVDCRLRGGSSIKPDYWQ